jgi:hypothetical protein
MADLQSSPLFFDKLDVVSLQEMVNNDIITENCRRRLLTERLCKIMAIFIQDVGAFRALLACKRAVLSGLSALSFAIGSF